VAIKHGTPGAYNAGCHCDICRECNANRQRNRRAHARSLRVLINGRWVSPVSIVKHGTYNGYNNWACRCWPCTTANNLKLAEYRRNRTS
jgi:hypothetical protein